MTNGSLRYGHSILWQSAENTWPLAKNPEPLFFANSVRCKRNNKKRKPENMQTAAAAKKVWLSCENFPGPAESSAPSLLESCCWPTKPSSVLTPKLWEWPSGGLLVLLIGVSTEHSNPTPTPVLPCTHSAPGGGTGWGRGRKKIAAVGNRLGNTELNFGCTEGKTAT